MKLLNHIFMAAIFVAAAFLVLSLNTFAENSAEGTLTVDGDKTAVKYAYADKYDDITIILVDNPVEAVMIPDSIYNLGEQGKIKGIVFVVDANTNELKTGGLYNLINAVHSHSKWNHLGSVGKGVLTVENSDGNTLSGKNQDCIRK